MRIIHYPAALILLYCAAPGLAAGDSFCRRVAPQLGAKPDEVIARNDASDTTGELHVNLMGGLRAALLGGSAMVSFSVHPADEDDMAEYKRLQNACQAASNGVLCKIKGPAKVRIGSPKGQLAAEVNADENVELQVRKSTLYCRDLKA